MKSEIFARIFEQSFLVVVLCAVCYFMVLEYKTLHEELSQRTERDERLMLDRLAELNEQKDQLYERLILKNGRK